MAGGELVKLDPLVLELAGELRDVEGRMQALQIALDGIMDERSRLADRRDEVRRRLADLVAASVTGSVPEEGGPCGSCGYWVPSGRACARCDLDLGGEA